MKLPRLSAQEVRALRVDGGGAAGTLSERIKLHFKAGLPPWVPVEVSILALSASAFEGEPPYLHADDDLLAAWVAARFGAGGVFPPVPARHGASLLARASQALAESVLRGHLDEISSLHLEFCLNDQCGRLELDWSDMSAKALRTWAAKQWGSNDG